MRTIVLPAVIAVCGFYLGGGTAPAGPVNMEYVLVGDSGNPDDTVTAIDGSGLYFGGVDYDYQIGKYEVTVAQYAAFLNAVAATDPNGLYHPSMDSGVETRAISRSGVSGNHTYAVIGDGDRPVTMVSMSDAMRFANWMHNGQPIGPQTSDTTEDGSYTLSLGPLAPRNPAAVVFIPSEDEWYKAAYYDPTKGGSNYWLYPTRSDDVPGNVIGPLPNQANYFTDLGSNVYSVTQSPDYNPSLNYLTPVGAFTSSASYYGTFDQGGNVFEWNEALIGEIRGLRGNAWCWGGAVDLQSTARGYSDPAQEINFQGFRVARLPDTDGDGIPDLFETGTGIYNSLDDTGTNPANPDSDGDGLLDGIEKSRHNTDPNKADTDSDGFTDGFEVSIGFDPTSDTSTPDALSRIRTAIEFEFNAAEGVDYRIEASANLVDWETIEAGIPGNSDVVRRLYSIRGQPNRYFRARRE